MIFITSAEAQIKVVMLPGPSESRSAGFESPSPEPVLLSPGHYVLPQPYSPTNFSPHIRPFPDYSTLRQSPGTPVNPSFGAYPAGYGPNGPILGYGGSFACGGFGSGGNSWGGDVQSAYNQGRYDSDHEYLWFIASQRAGRLINQSAAEFDDGIRCFRDGQYDKALMNWLGAAELNNDNAAPYLHAGHALFALGRYDEAVVNLARAFELMPALAYKPYNIRAEYGRPDDFDRQRADLEEYVNHHPRDASALTLLGYITYYTTGPAAAHSALVRASHLDPHSYFIPKLLNVSRQTVSQVPPKHQSTKPTQRKRTTTDSPRGAARLAMSHGPHSLF